MLTALSKPEVLGAAQVRAHLGERRRPGAEGEARDAQAELDAAVIGSGRVLLQDLVAR